MLLHRHVFDVGLWLAGQAGSVEVPLAFGPRSIEIDVFRTFVRFFHQTVGYPQSTIALEIPHPYIRGGHEYNQKIGPLSDRQ